MLECEDKSLYTGITHDITARIRTHYYKLPAAAKYTKSHKIKNIMLLFKTETKNNALKLEAYIKTFSKSKKQELINNPSLIYEKFEEPLFETAENIKLEDFLICQSEEYEKLKKFYQNEKILDFLNGNIIGKAYSDNPKNPKMACVIIDETCYFSGKINDEFLKLSENKTV